jgi:predicted MFS family arabinose efflux permease
MQRGPISLVLGGFLALASAMGIGRFVYTPILPKMVADLGLSASEAGLIASANFAGYLIGALVAVAPFFAARQRRWMLVGLAFSALSTAGMAATASLPMFVILRFIGGVASAFVLVFSSSLVMERLTAAGKIRLASYQFAGVGTGIALSAALVERLAAHGFAWQWQWSATAFLSLLAFAAVAALIGPAPQGVRSKDKAAAKTSLSAPLLALVLSYGLFGFGYVITATFLVQLVRTNATIAPIEPMIWLIVGLAAIPSVAVWSAVGRRIGAGYAYALACLIEAAGVLASVLWIAPAGAVLAAALLGGTLVGITILGFVLVRKLVTGDVSRMIALMTAAFGLGQIIGPIFAGWMRDLTGSFLLPSVAAAGTLLVAALLVGRYGGGALR